RTRERDEAQRRAADGRAREQAVAEILQLLSANPTDQPAVFRAVLEAMRTVHGGGSLLVIDGDALRPAGTLAEPAPPVYPSLSRPGGATAGIRERRTIYVPDIAAPEGAAYPVTAQRMRATGMRSVLNVPIMSEGKPLGVLASVRPEVAAFDEARIRLLEML